MYIKGNYLDYEEIKVLINLKIPKLKLEEIKGEKVYYKLRVMMKILGLF